MTAKEMALGVIRDLPDDATTDDILDALDTHGAPAAGTDREFDPDEWEPEYAAEINRRIEDMRSGKTIGVPIEEVLRQLREKCG